MIKKHYVGIASVLLLFLSLSTICHARPAWVSISYSGFTLHRNHEQNDVAGQGYYYAKIIATCVNNSADKTITGITNRSMAFTANARGNGMELGEASGSVVINNDEALTPVGPGETFRIEYSVPVLHLNGGSVAPLNNIPGARLSRYRLKHDFNVR